MLPEFLDLVSDVVATAVCQHGIRHFPLALEPLGQRKMLGVGIHGLSGKSRGSNRPGSDAKQYGIAQRSSVMQPASAATINIPRTHPDLLVQRCPVR
jgi:hypothetical protein